jgi:hypothetical protein
VGLFLMSLLKGKVIGHDGDQKTIVWLKEAFLSDPLDERFDFLNG